MPMDQTLIATQDVAKRLSVTVATVSRWVQSGRLESAHRLPGKTGAYLFDRAEVERFAATREVSA